MRAISLAMAVWPRNSETSWTTSDTNNEIVSRNPDLQSTGPPSDGSGYLITSQILLEKMP
jgi:hypothetical protein